MGWGRGRRVAACAVVTTAMFGCAETGSLPTQVHSADVATEWMQLLYDRVRIEGTPPMRAARIYGYNGVALYEAVVPGMPEHLSLAGQLNGDLTVPSLDLERTYDWPTVASAAIATTATGLFEGASAATLASIADLHEDQVRAREDQRIARDVLDRSIEAGRAVGTAVVAWAGTDGYRETRTRTYTVPVGPSFWEPTPPAFAASPLEPYWGDLRPMALSRADACRPDGPPAFSTDPSSAFHAEAETVHRTSLTLTDEQRDIAIFWADNAGQTGTPPGHWVSILRQFAIERPLSLAQVAEGYARLGIAVNDAFIGCWREKYDVNLLRPVTYVRRHIDPAWLPLIATPPFPEYTSGHSTQSGAAATVLTDLYGAVPFTDRTLTPLGFRERSFLSFEAAAREAAVSRLYGGIHFPSGNDDGIRQGQCIGRAVIERARTRR